MVVRVVAKLILGRLQFLITQLSEYAFNVIETPVCALRACSLCVYNYSHVVCYVQQLFLVASSYKLFNL